MPAATAQFHGEIETPRPLRARDGQVRVAGWCFAAGQRTAPAVRLACAAGILPMTGRLPRTDVPAKFPQEPAAGLSGFVIEGHLPAGVFLVRLEAQLAAGAWQVFKVLSLAVEPPPFAAGIESPSPGIVRQRVHVHGWALQPDQPIAALTLRYGHQEIAAQPGKPRPDLVALFPGAPRAELAGFVSEFILGAGQGPLRVKARLADGTARVARTPLQIDIATDENYGPGFDFRAARVALPGYARRPAIPPAIKTEQPRNILFILYGSFASNSALHATALANELAAAGHDCAIAVPHDLETLDRHQPAAFRGLTYAEAERGGVFANGRGPEIIHAWTTRENVRAVAQKLREAHRSRLVVHLEDNEQEILALTLQRPAAALEQLPATELDRLVPPDLSHPLRSRKFLAEADGVTVITERLREFVPPGRPCHVIQPAADARDFYPRPRPDEFRAALGFGTGTIVLFYHGNVHAANAAEMRELYAAVLQLNRAGQSAVLLRTGLDRVDFLGAMAAEVAPFVFALGEILHHRHLPPLMALADIFVQPGAPDAFNDYRFPSKLPEFFALGRPVVLPRTNLGATLRHGIDAYVLPRADAAGIVAAISELHADRALYDRLAAGALAFSAQHFSWRRSAEALAKFYGTLAAS
ncbi:MAG: putative glycosyl transferase [Lacunisphaera sp.]|nr:putative glycosyl transferase [Lacunisphaera sp.]